MVCQNEVLGLFKGLKSHKRLDLMVSLLHASLPYELRYFGTILEYLGKKDFHELRLAETEANNVSDLNSAKLHISSPKARLRLTLYLALLRSSSYNCSNVIFQLLMKEVNELTALYKNGDDSVLDDLLLIFSLATHHPAFTFKQHTELKEIYDRLKAEEEDRCGPPSPFTASCTGGPLNLALDRVPCVSQAYPGCVTEENHLVGVPTNSPTLPPIPTPVDAGFNVQDAVSGAPIRMPFPSHHSPLLINPNWAIVTNSAIHPGGGSDSPLQSRTSSPCSRPGSPSPGSNPTATAATSAPPVVPQAVPPPTVPSVRGKFPPPRVPPPSHGAPNDTAFKETIIKEMPKYSNSLQHFTSDQLSRMSDEDLREINLPASAVSQLRTILNNRSATLTNGIGPGHLPDTAAHPGNEFKKKGEPSGIINEPENMRRFHLADPMPLYPGGVPGTGPIAAVCSHMDPNACMACYSVAVNANTALPGGSPGNGGNNSRNKQQPTHHCLPLGMFAPGWCPTYTVQQPHHSMPVGPPHPSHLQFASPAMPVEAMRGLRLIGTGGNHPDNDPSSASDTASDHSPPDTPAPVQVMPTAGVEPAEERINSEDRRGVVRSHGGQPRGLGRNRNGIQNISRGRGHNHSHRRRDLICNGNPDRGQINGPSDRSGEAPSPGPQATPPPTAYFSYMTASPYVRHGPACYQPATATYHPGPYVHQGPYPPPSYHNGTCHVISTDLMYPYAPGLSGPPTGGGGASPFLPPPPPQPSYSPAATGPPPPQSSSQQLPPPPPPPPVGLQPMPPKGPPSCYNCGSQVHLPDDCPEQTIDEITKQGQYRIDYTPNSSSTGAANQFQSAKVSDLISPSSDK